MMKKYLRLLVVAFALSGCSSGQQALVITGESLKGVALEFVQVGNVYKTGCDVTKVIAPSSCADFRTFGQRFQQSFPLAVQLWEAARSATDTAAQEKVSAVITEMASSLSSFAINAIATFQGGK